MFHSLFRLHSRLLDATAPSHFLISYLILAHTYFLPLLRRSAVIPSALRWWHIILTSDSLYKMNVFSLESIDFHSAARPSWSKVEDIYSLLARLVDRSIFLLSLQKQSISFVERHLKSSSHCGLPFWPSSSALEELSLESVTSSELCLFCLQNVPSLFELLHSYWWKLANCTFHSPKLLLPELLWYHCPLREWKRWHIAVVKL